MDLWNNENPVREICEAIDVPDWIDKDISPYTVAAIEQGGCESGAYMPAVTYYTAMQTMTTHGDDVLDFINEHYGELPNVNDQSWSGIACTYLSFAVELWALSAHALLQDMDDEDDDEEEDD